MTTFAELDQLTSKELHDRAVHRARHRLDVAFFWELLKAIPTAEVAAGHIDHGQTDLESASSLVFDAFKTDDGALADALRPVYIDYLLKHPAG